MLLELINYPRTQFALTIGFHILFPTVTIGLSIMIAALNGAALGKQNKSYANMAHYLTRLFTLFYILGIATGIAVALQFNANWGGFWDKFGLVLKPIFSFGIKEVLALEIPCLIMMLFFRHRVPQWAVFLASLVICLGTLFSVFRVISVNSWMHCPSGHEWVDGRALPANWMDIIFSPTFKMRYFHVVLAACLTASLLLLSIGIRGLSLKTWKQKDALWLIKGSLLMLICCMPLQFIVGHQHGLDVKKDQPAKLAAMEGHWDGSKTGDLVLFGVPNSETERNDYEIALPKLASLIVTHDINGLFAGLKEFKKADRPPFGPVFYGFRIMMGSAILMVVLAVWGGVLMRRGHLLKSRLFLLIGRHSWILGFIAMMAGWMVAERGRQPWVATGLVRTEEIAPAVATNATLISLLYFMFTVFILAPIIARFFWREINLGPR